MRYQEGDIVWDDEFYLNNWPNLNENSWVGIYEPKEKDPLWNTTICSAYLFIGDTYNNKTINLIEEMPEDIFIAEMKWKVPSEFESVGLILTLRVSDDYQKMGVGYFFAESIRCWFHENKRILLTEPPPDFRSKELEPLVKKIAVALKDNSMLFYEPLDEKYYHYDEWASIYQ